MRLIDADALIDNIYAYPDHEHSIMEDFAERVEMQETVDHVKHGQWKATPYTDYDDTYECSVCGACWTFIEGTPKDNEAFYCPHCGAKMDEVEE